MSDSFITVCDVCLAPFEAEKGKEYCSIACAIIHVDRCLEVDLVIQRIQSQSKES